MYADRLRNTEDSMTKTSENNKAPFLLERVMKLMAGTEWQERMQSHFSEFYMPAARRNKMTGVEYLVKAGVERLAFISRFVLDDFMTRWYGKNGELNLVHNFIRNISGVDKDFHLAQEFEIYELIAESRPTMYEVVDVTRGVRTVLRDMIYGGEDIVIEETVTLSEMTELWQCLAGRAVLHDDVPFLSPNFLPFDQQMAGDFLDKLERIIEEKLNSAGADEKSGNTTSQVTREDILAGLPMSQMLADSWNAAIDERGGMRFGLPPPTLGTVEGGIVEICEVTFRASDELQRIAERLDAIPSLSRITGEDRKWNWNLPREGLAEYLQAIVESEDHELSDERSEVNSNHEEWLGIVELNPRTLTLWVPSKPRAEAGEKLLISCLGDLVTNPMLTYTNSHEETKKILDSLKPGLNELSMPEIFTSMHGYFRNLYYGSATDIPSREYDDMTPREMALSSRERRKALEWLKMRECTDRVICREHGLDLYDFTWMWQELGFSTSQSHADDSEQ